MSETWITKDGPRRVRHDPPTVEEAVLAAQGLTDEPGEQAEIVASLMQISAEEARAAVLRIGRRAERTERLTVSVRRGHGGSVAVPRAVVVERRLPRRRAMGG